MVDTLSREKRSWNMSRIHGKDTKPELMLRSMLHQSGFRFRKNDKRLPGKPDIVLPKYRTVIFVNGCFWHRHSGCKYTYIPKTRQDFWFNKFENTIRRDKEMEKKLIKLEWQVIVTWECELKNKPKQLLNEISSKIVGVGDGC